MLFIRYRAKQFAFRDCYTTPTHNGTLLEQCNIGGGKVPTLRFDAVELKTTQTNRAMRKSMIQPATGVLLISEPFLADSYFKRSVVLISEHDDKGALGFILNKPTDVTINDAVEDFPVFNSRLYFGGPVETDTLFYIHTIGEKLEGAKPIGNGIYWGGSYDHLKTLIHTGEVTPDMIRFYAGYSGWDADQLGNELREKSWLVSEGNARFTFYDDPNTLWSQVLRSMGNEYAVMANFPEDPALN